MPDSLKLNFNDDSLLIYKLCPLALFFKLFYHLAVYYSRIYPLADWEGSAFPTFSFDFISIRGTLFGELASLFRNYLNWLVKNIAYELLADDVLPLLLIIRSGILIYSSWIWGSLSLYEACSSRLSIFISGFIGTIANYFLKKFIWLYFSGDNGTPEFCWSADS
jgi:hypothetical protein